LKSILGKKMQSSVKEKNNQEFLPVSMAMETVYCPRNFWLRYVEKETWKDHRMLKGSIQDDVRISANRLKNIAKKRIERDVLFFSERLGLAGKLDCLNVDDWIPEEYKTGPLQYNDYDRCQLCCYGLMIEERLEKSCLFGYLYYTDSKRKIRVDFTPELRKKVEDAAELAWDIVLSSCVPPPIDSEQCRGCALKERCLPDLINKIQGKVDRIPAGIGMGRTFEHTICIDEPWGYMKIKNKNFQFIQGKDERHDIPIEMVDAIIIIGSINFSHAALKEILRRNIHVSLLSYGGRYEGEIISEFSKNVPLRAAQARSGLDNDLVIEFSRGFLEGKLANSCTLLNRYNRKLQNPEISKAVDRIKRIKDKLVKTKDSSILLGLEGTAAAVYFNVFSLLINNKDFIFTHREKRPPTDPVNALLSFGYVMLTSQLRGICYLVGLDPFLGFFHQEKYGKPSLALDVLEEFRAIFIDALVLNLINRNSLKMEHFSYQSSGACYLNEKGRRVFLQAFFKRMRDKVIHPLINCKLSYRRVMEIQLRLLARRILGEFDRYKPFKAR